mmetsp:Transcript_18759/g.24357  ORF Transcript_18759/g.24357 Transcript_18759/m.24357 type:complete len:111 (-) Transcript_18759:15-347(-)
MSIMQSPKFKQTTGSPLSVHLIAYSTCINFPSSLNRVMERSYRDDEERPETLRCGRRTEYAALAILYTRQMASNTSLIRNRDFIVIKGSQCNVRYTRTMAYFLRGVRCGV